MRGTTLMIRAGRRGRRGLLVLLAILTALACGFALTAETGARRTATAWDRLNDRTLAPDALAEVDRAELARARATIEDRPDVASLGAFAYVPAFPQDNPAVADVGMFAGFGPGFGTEVLRPVIDEGRVFDPTRDDELLVNAAYAELAGVGVGDQVHLVGPAGIEQDATIVGIGRTPLEIGPNGGAPSALGTPAFTERWLPALEQLPGFDVVRPVIGFRFEDGVDVDAALAELTEDLPPGTAIIDAAGLEADIRDGVEAGSNAFWVLALASTVGAVILLSVLAARAVRPDANVVRVLAAVGAPRSRRALAQWVPVAVALAVGGAAAPLVAAITSPWVRTGFARVADPDRGWWIEGRTLFPSAVALTAILLLAAGLSALRSARLPVGGDSPSPERGRGITAFAWLPPAPAVGAGAAVGGPTTATRRTTLTTLVTLGAALTCVVAALTWRASDAHLTDDMRLQGWTFDATIAAHADTSEDQVDALGTALSGSDAVDGITQYRHVVMPLRDVEIDLFTFLGEPGGIEPVVTAGRMPAAAGEIAVGREVAAIAGVTVGDELELESEAGATQLQVVGEVIFPLIGNTGFGLEGIVTGDSAEALQLDVLNAGYLVDLADGASIDDLRDIAGGDFAVAEPFSPPNIQRLEDVRGIGSALVWFFLLLGLAVFAFGVVATGALLRRDHAVLRTLGFRPRQVRSAFATQALVSVGLGAVVAVPLGIAAGRGIWVLTERDLGVLPAFQAPAPSIAIAIVTLAAGCVGIGLLAATQSARHTVAVNLRAE